MLDQLTEGGNDDTNTLAYVNRMIFIGQYTADDKQSISYLISYLISSI